MDRNVLNLIRIPVIAFCMLFPEVLSAQTTPWAFGTIHSPKYFGFTAAEFCDGSRETFTLAADMNGIIGGISSSPGIRATYMHEKDVLNGNCNFADSYSLYYGIGAGAGYVSDTEPQRGIMAGMCLGFGSRFTFLGCISITLAFQADIAMHISVDRIEDNINLGLYRRGLKSLYLPQLTINYSFR